MTMTDQRPEEAVPEHGTVVVHIDREERMDVTEEGDDVVAHLAVCTLQAHISN